MPKVIYVEPTDEISDLVDYLRSANEPSLALVVPHGSRAVQTPLNFRLLAQFSKSANKETAIVSGDPRIQRAARDFGFPTYASVEAYERGIELVRPHEDRATLKAGTAAGGAAVAAPPAVELSEVWTSAGPPGRTTPTPSSKSGGKDRRRAMIFGAVALTIVGLLVLLFVTPSAVVTVTVAATPVSLQKTTLLGEAAAGSNVDFTTQVVTADAAGQFQANPTGKKNVPAAPATGTVTFRTKLPSGASFKPIPKNEEFDTADGIKFFVTADTDVFVPVPTTPGSYSDASNPVPVQEGSAEQKGNVPAGAVSKWPGNPCAHSGLCSESDITVSNPQPTTGGADASTQTVASDADLASWNTQLNGQRQTLTAKINQDMQNNAAGRVLAQGGGTLVGCDITPPLPASGDQFPASAIQISCHGKSTTYSPQDVRNKVIALLNVQKPQGEQLALDQCQFTNPSVSTANETGHVVLQFAGSPPSCFSTPIVQLDSIKGSLTCKSPDDVHKTLIHQFDTISSVDIQEKPFSLPFLPCFSSQITIHTQYVAAKNST